MLLSAQRHFHPLFEYFPFEVCRDGIICVVFPTCHDEICVLVMLSFSQTYHSLYPNGEILDHGYQGNEKNEYNGENVYNCKQIIVTRRSPLDIVTVEERSVLKGSIYPH